MQVQHTFEAENYAIVGGEAARAFKIGQSAHAFRILSDTLYSNKKRAVVREILCNAIDAHIAAGKVEVPVEVSLSEVELRIQDFGLGIPDENIVDIYATYFASSKTSDNTQTGGFGLGSKAPFAYTDHFSVISAHKGMQTVYALHIDDEQSGGTPAVRPMGRMKSENSGVTVAVPLADKKDYAEFGKMIREIVREGGMNVRLNGDLLPAPDMTELRRQGYGVMHGGGGYDGSATVLYANVLYPLPNNAVKGLEDLIRGVIGNSCKLILAAPPSSVSVTPSREALSLDRRTLDTVAALVAKARKGIAAFLAYGCKQAAIRRAENLSLFETGLGRKGVIDATCIERAVVHAGGRAVGIYLGEVAFSQRYHLTTLNFRRFMKQAAKRLRIPALAKVDDTYSLQDLQTTIEHRRVVKIARKLDLSLKLYFRNSTGNRVKKVLGDFEPEGSSGRIHIAATRADMLHHKASGYYLVVADLTDQRFAEITAMIKKYGLSTALVPPKPIYEFIGPPRPPAPPPPMLTFKIGSNNFRSRIGYVHKVDGEPTKTPSAYLYLPNVRDEKRRVQLPRNWDDEKVDKRIAAWLPDVVVATDRRELLQIQEAKAPRLCDLVLKEAQKRIKKDKDEDKLYILMARSVMGNAQHGMRGTYSLGNFIKALLAQDRRSAHVCWNLPYRSSKSADAVYAFWFMAIAFFHEGLPRIENDHPEQIAHEAARGKFNTAVKSFVPQPASNHTCYQQFTGKIPHLSVFATFMNSFEISDFERYSEQLYDLIDYHRKTMHKYKPKPVEGDYGE